MSVNKEFFKTKRFIFLCLLFLFGLILIGIGLSGLSLVIERQVERAIINKIIAGLPSPIALHYDKIRVNPITRKAIIPNVSVYNKEKEENELKIKRVILKSSEVRDKIPLSAFICMEGITTESAELQKGLSHKKISGLSGYFGRYFEKTELSICGKYHYHPKQKIMDVDYFRIKYGDKINVDMSVKLENITGADIRRVVKAKDKFSAIRAVLVKSRPLDFDFLINMDLDKLNIKELVGSFDAGKNIQPALGTGNFPKELDFIFKQHISSDAKSKELKIRDITVGFEPGFIISLNSRLQNVGYDRMIDYNKVQISDIKLKVMDKKGIETIIRIMSDLTRKTEDQIRKEYKMTFFEILRMYKLKALLGDDGVKTLKKFLFEDKDTLIIKNKRKTKISIGQITDPAGGGIAGVISKNIILK